MTKKNIMFLSISLVLMILLGIGVSYSLWNISVSQDTNNTAYTECFDLSITNKENNINLDNAYPISNDKGKSLTPYTFTVTNTCDITTQYNINLEVLNSSTLSSKFIDVMFEGNINLLSSYDNTDKVNTSSIESRKLTTGILKSKESKDYSLRLWIDYNTTLEDLNNEVKSFKSKIVVVGKPINYTGDTVFNFDYTGGEQTFTAPVSGTYKLETWGAQGSGPENNIGGFGGYAVGFIKFDSNYKTYINIGGAGSVSSDAIGSVSTGGYNGGGDGTNKNPGCDKFITGSGGGATDISLVSGLLSELENNKNSILLVSGGGGGGNFCNIQNHGTGGSGGGKAGNSSYGLGYDFGLNGYGTGANQIEAGCGTKNYHCGNFGKGFSSNDSYGAGGGGGFFGGGSSHINAAGGGSGYIGNSLLKSKVMYCYNCEESNEENTKTISTTCIEETPTSYCAKKGNGYARITLVSIDE